MTASTTMLPTMRLSRRNYGLDIARAIAITTVVLVHFVLEDTAIGPIYRNALAVIGAASVELFFSLSGFLIGWLLIDLVGRELSPRTVFQFWSRRWMRTLPLYFLVLAYTSWQAGQTEPHAWFFLQNFYPAEPKLVPVAWSLVMEEYFYFFFPVVMLVVSAALGGSVRLVAGTAVLLIVVCTASRVVNAYGSLGLGWEAVHEHPFMRMDCSAYGMLAVCLYRRYPQAMTRFVHRWRWALLAAAVGITAFLTAVAVFVLDFWSDAVAWGFGVWGNPWFIFQHSILDIAYAVAVMTLFVMRSGPGHTVWAGLVHRCSLYSYSIYLVHMAVLSLAVRFLHWSPGPAIVAVEIAGTVVVSLITYHAIERPFLALRDVLSSGRRQTTVDPLRRSPAQAPG